MSVCCDAVTRSLIDKGMVRYSGNYVRHFVPILSVPCQPSPAQSSPSPAVVLSGHPSNFVSALTVDQTDSPLALVEEPDKKNIEKAKAGNVRYVSTLPILFYQSSSSSPFLLPCMLACRCLNASANPPAKLLPPPPDGLPSTGVPRPLLASPILLPPMLTALSRGVGNGAGFLVPARLTGGAGGAGLEPRLETTPLGPKPFATGTDRVATGGGGGGGGGVASSVR